MDTLIVQNWMTKNVFTVTRKHSLPEIHGLMQSHHIRRVPVLESGKLVGIVTLNDVLEAAPAGATNRSSYERNMQRAHITAQDVMRQPVITVKPSSAIKSAAKLMLDNKIGGLPVVEDDELVGIITESDIFRVLISLLANGNSGSGGENENG
jgi:acetoin utilization protein AcuB